MTLGRAVAGGALAIAIVVVAFTLLSGGDGTRYTLRFQNAGQLVNDNDVQIGGRRIGSVKEIRLTDRNEADVEIEVSEDYAPLKEGTRARIRATSLSGVANRYIALEPGTGADLDDGAVLDLQRTTSIVDLDQLFNTLDPKTRESLQKVIDGSARQFEDRGDEANRAARYFSPALSTSSRLVNELVRDQKAFTDFLVYSSKVSTALAARRDDLSGLVANTNSTAAAIADEDRALAEALGLLPRTLRKANTTFVNLRSTLADLDVLVAESKPATRRLTPFLKELRPLVRDAEPTIADLRRLIRKPGAGNDLIDLTRKTPALERASRSAFPNSQEALRKVTPVLGFIRPYTPDFMGWVRDFGLSTANYDANGHFARIQPIFNAFQFTSDPVVGNVLNALPPEARTSGTEIGNLRRCPGGATAELEDGSNNWRDSDGNLDCDPALAPKGP